MTHFHDMAKCDYFGDELAPVLRAVGWLTDNEAFSIGRTDPKTFTKLKELLRDPWQPMVFGGVHHCELCQHDRPISHKNLFVPIGSCIFVCPELIIHYIAAHHYRPPDQFIAAIAACPDTRTMQYKELLLASGGRVLVSKQG